MFFGVCLTLTTAVKVFGDFFRQTANNTHTVLGKRNSQTGMSEEDGQNGISSVFFPATFPLAREQNTLE
jgi:hypothetical protein